ncbi:ATP-binding protein [Aquimarina sp. AU119]|uniref:ATP-binding protein n=1 Tax=Aquimarina sp. AU119 TaxID=2108528 RepID=UPI000D6988AA|nr:ATP-binding protein [Aquimarina sp. AU119]
MTKKIIYVLFILCNVCFSQVKPTDEDRKLINQHIDYVNHCNEYLLEVIEELDELNGYIKTNADNYIEGHIDNDDLIEIKNAHEPLPIINRYEKWDWSPGKLQQEFIQLGEFRKKNPSEVSRILKEVINTYQSKFNELKDLENQLVKLSNNKMLFFESLTFENSYGLLTKYELKYKELILINYQFRQTTQKIFGEEELPIVLQLTKDIISSAQGMIHSVRKKDKKQLQKFINIYKKSIRTHNTFKDKQYEELEVFFEEHHLGVKLRCNNIKSWSDDIINQSINYLKEKHEPITKMGGIDCEGYKGLGYEIRMIDRFNSILLRKYNDFNPKVPMLHIVKELTPFRVCFPTAIPEEEYAAVMRWDEDGLHIKGNVFINGKKVTSRENLPTKITSREDLVTKQKGTTPKKEVTNNLVVLIDLSTSKKEKRKLDKLKSTVIGLIETLQPEDQLTIVTYTAIAVNKIIKTGTDYDKKTLRQIISGLTFTTNTNKKTSAKSGLMLAYKESLDSFIEKGSNRIVILSDGAFEASTEFKNEIQKQVDKGVYLSTLHYTTKKQPGTNTLTDLAKLGKGTYNPIINEGDVLETLKNEVLSLKQTQLLKENEILSLRKEQLVKENEILSLRKEQSLKENEIARQRAVKKTILIAFIIILIPIIVLLYVYFQKLRAQHKLRDKQEEINQQKVTSLIKNQELKLIKASITGEHKERERIAQELHDSIGGNLSSIKLQLANFNEGTFNYDKIVNQIDETYELARDMSHNLIPKKFVQNPFTNLIEEYVENLNSTRNHHIICDLYPVEELNMINENLQVEIFKIIQELLTNTIKHANADKITIQLNHFEDAIKLLFEDDGVGFVVSKNRFGIGLTNIKNRLKKLAGEMHIDSTPKRGTIVNIDIPIVIPTLNNTHDEI